MLVPRAVFETLFLSEWQESQREVTACIKTFSVTWWRGPTIGCREGTEKNYLQNSSRFHSVYISYILVSASLHASNVVPHHSVEIPASLSSLPISEHSVTEELLSCSQYTQTNEPHVYSSKKWHRCSNLWIDVCCCWCWHTDWKIQNRMKGTRTLLQRILSI